MIYLLIFLTLCCCVATADYTFNKWRTRTYADLSNIVESRWACRKIAKALEIDGDGEDPGSYVQWALRDALKSHLMTDSHGSAR